MNNLDLVKVYSDLIWNDKNLSRIDQFLSENIVINSPLERIIGIDAMVGIIARWHKAFSDLKVSWDDFISEGDKVVSRWTTEGVHTGDFLGHRPTNKKVSYNGVSIYRISDDKIVEYWAFVDMLGLKQQLIS